jgi:UTP--glucose-1-phosphate uridylyltransferase
MRAMDLERQLRELDPSLRERLDRAGFDAARFVALAATLREADGVMRRRERNVVRGEVTAPRPEEIRSAEKEHAARGREAIARGELACCAMAGGMATRMGGIVKALCEVFDGHTFLDLRLAENRAANARSGATVPLWLMTSDATDAAIRAALEGTPEHVACFMQNLSLRLTPEGGLFYEDSGEPSFHATGHGDLVDALRRSGLLDAFLSRGGKYVWITNIDNLGASIDEALLGQFIASGAEAQCEVSPKAGDKGGIPVHAEGKLQVLEEFRLPPSFDARTVDVFNTNTFLVSAEKLARAPFTWTFFEVEKKVDGRPAIQFERLIQEITAHLSTTYVKIPREGEASRFLPVKDAGELAARRPTIEAVARARGMV